MIHGQTNSVLGLPLPLHAELRALLSIRGDNSDMPCKSSPMKSSRCRKQRKEKDVRHLNGQHSSNSTFCEQSSQQEDIGIFVNANIVKEELLSGDVESSVGNGFREYNGDLIQDIVRIIRLRRATNLIKDYLIASDCPCDVGQCWGANYRARQQTSSNEEEHGLVSGSKESELKFCFKMLDLTQQKETQDQP